MTECEKASWSKLTTDEIKTLEGHVGPGWLPQKFCNKMTYWFTRIYQIAVQEHHDFGYIVGGTAEDRFHCDRELLRHMRQDCDSHHGEMRRLACFVTDLIYIVVRMLGWLSFQWRDKPLTHPEVKAELARKKQQLEAGSESPVKWLSLALVFLPLILFSLVSYLVFKTLPLCIGLLRNKSMPADTCQEESAT